MIMIMLIPPFGFIPQTPLWIWSISSGLSRLAHPVLALLCSHESLSWRIWALGGIQTLFVLSSIAIAVFWKDLVVS